MLDPIVPDWPAPGNVRALSTTRRGGVSGGRYAGFNLGDHVGDDPQAVSGNRRALRAVLPDEPRWLKQVHGTAVADVGSDEHCAEADAALCRVPGRVCVVMTADCLPVVFCDRAGRVVAAAHAGWRGLVAGVLERTVAAMAVPPSEIIAWLGPAIGPSFFEVGDEVRRAFVEIDHQASAAFVPTATGKWTADLFRLGRQRLRNIGVAGVFGGEVCTYGDPGRFFSHRRDGVSGRMATLIWLA